MKKVQVIRDFGPTKLNNAEHSEFHSGVYGYITSVAPETFNCTAENMAEYHAAQQAEEELIGRQTASVLTAEVDAADDERDALLGYMFSQVDSIAKSPLPAQKEAGRQLKVVLKPYRGIAEDALAQKSTEIRSMLTHLRVPEMTEQVAAVQALSDTMASLETANEKTAALMSQRTGTEQEKAESRAKRAITDDCYGYIKQRIDSTIVLQPNDSVKLLRTEIDNLIQRTLTAYNTRMGMRNANNEASQELESDEKDVSNAGM